VNPDPSEARVVIDTRGTFCPIPIIKTSEAIGNLDSGGVVEVISDDPAVEYDMPAWCRSMGHAIVEWSKEGDVYRYFIRKKQGT